MYDEVIIPEKTMIFDLVVFKNDMTIHPIDRGIPNKNNPEKGMNGFSKLAFSKSSSICSFNISADMKKTATTVIVEMMPIILNKFII